MEDESDLYYGDLNEEALKVPNQVEPKKYNEKLEKNKKEVVESSADKTFIHPKIDPIVLTPIAMPSLHLYPINNYTFGSKDTLMEIETSYHNRMANLAYSFAAEGMKRTVEAVMLTYENNHPHVLLLHI